MRSIGRALTWEFWRRQRWMFLTVFANSVFMMFWIWLITSGGSPRTWNNAPDVKTVTMLYRVALCVVLWGCTGVLLSGFVDKRKRMVFSVRHYALPVRTSVLVAWQMVHMSVLVSALVLVMAVCFQLFTGLSFPVLAPALFCCAALAWTIAGLWILKGSQFLALFFVAIGPILLILCFGNGVFFRETWRSEMGTLGEAPLPVLILLFLLSLLAAYLIGVAGAARDRRGDSFSLAPVREWLSERLGSFRTRQKRFSSPAAAQFWFEWRQKGHLMPIIAAVIHACIMVFSLAGVISRPGHAFETAIGFSCVFLSLAWFPMGLLFGMRDTSSGKWELGAFAATRPLRDRDLSFATLKAGAASIAATFAVCVLAISVWAAWFLATGNSGVLLDAVVDMVGKGALHPYLLALLYLCGMLLSGWTLMALMACFTLTGHKWVLGVVGAIFYVFFFGWITLQTPGLLSADTRKALFETLGIIISFGGLLGTSAAFTAAYRKGLIGKGLVLLSAGLWLILALCAAGLLVRSHKPEPVPLSLLIGLMALPVAPLALAPLALSWNRHR